MLAIYAILGDDWAVSVNLLYNKIGITRAFYGLVGLMFQVIINYLMVFCII